MELSNSERNEHGKMNQKCVELILEFCEQQGYIKEFKKDFSAGKKGFGCNNQFKAPFILEFTNNERWIVYTTTSLRDRIKSQQWDSFNLKSEFPDITKSIVVYPDSASKATQNQFISKNKKYIEQFEFSAIDALVNQSEFSNMIEERFLSTLSVGQAKDKQGKVFEKKIASILSSNHNINKWKYNRATDVGIHFNTFLKIVNALQLDAEEIENISATNDSRVIGKLPTGGNPKTDVLVTVHYNNNTEEVFTISCKRTSHKKVSMHEYTADAFADFLDALNDELRDLLNKFQAAGSKEKFGDKNEDRLTQLLKPYNEKITLWVVGGIGGIGNPDTQWAKYILTYDNNTDEISIHSVSDYYKVLLNNHISGNFGTMFQWTYPSKKRGRAIQLKGAVIK